MEDKSKIKKVWNICNRICIVVYTIFGFLGSIAEEGTTNEIYLLVLEPKEFWMPLKILYAISLALSYPLYLLPTFDVFD